MTKSITDWPIERMIERADQIEKIAAKWPNDEGFGDTCRMEAAALRFAATQIGLIEFQKQREAERAKGTCMCDNDPNTICPVHS